MVGGEFHPAAPSVIRWSKRHPHMRLTTTLTAFVSGLLILTASAVQGQTASKAKPTSEGRVVEHAIVGTIQKVDAGAKTVVINTAQGTEEILRLTERTVVRAAEAVARPVSTAGRAADHAAATAALAGKEGSMAVVRYTAEGGEKVATLVEHVAASALRMTEGTVVRVADGGRTVVVKTAAGAEETFHFAEQGIVDGGRGVTDAAKFTGKELKAGGHVTVHYTESAGRKVAHLLKHVL